MPSMLVLPPGGKLPEEWRPILVQAIRRGLSIASGLHDFLVEDSEYVGEASMSGAKLIDVRRNAFKETGKAFPFAQGVFAFIASVTTARSAKWLQRSKYNWHSRDLATQQSFWRQVKPAS